MSIPSILLGPLPSAVTVSTAEGVRVATSIVLQRTVPEDARAASFEYLLTLDECVLEPPYRCAPWTITRLIGRPLRVSFSAPGLPQDAVVEGVRLRQVAFTLTGVGLFLDIPVSEPIVRPA